MTQKGLNFIFFLNPQRVKEILRGQFEILFLLLLIDISVR